MIYRAAFANEISADKLETVIQPHAKGARV